MERKHWNYVIAIISIFLIVLLVSFAAEFRAPTRTDKSGLAYDSASNNEPAKQPFKTYIEIDPSLGYRYMKQ